MSAQRARHPPERLVITWSGSHEVFCFVWISSYLILSQSSDYFIVVGCCRPGGINPWEISAADTHTSS